MRSEHPRQEYAATKAGLHAFTMAMRTQLAPLGIKVFEIVPPAVDTDLNPEGRAKRGGYKPNVTATEFVSAVMKRLADPWIHSSRAAQAVLLQTSWTHAANLISSSSTEATWAP